MEKFMIRYLDQFGNLTLVKRELEDDMTLDIIREYFIDFLKGAGYSDYLINEMFSNEKTTFSVSIDEEQ